MTLANIHNTEDQAAALELVVARVDGLASPTMTTIFSLTTVPAALAAILVSQTRRESFSSRTVP